MHAVPTYFIAFYSLIIPRLFLNYIKNIFNNITQNKICEMTDYQNFVYRHKLKVKSCNILFVNQL